MPVLELELTYLAASLPAGLKDCRHLAFTDIYFPDTVNHPQLRIRHKGDHFELTKKTPADPNDAGAQYEENIMLTAIEFEALAKGGGRQLTKTRYYLPYQGLTAEVDVFSGSLQGLVVIEFEFDDSAKKEVFVKPDFCLVDVTQEEFIAGGILAGKAYQDIASELERFHYTAL